MINDLFRQGLESNVQRLFGESATITGSIGSARAPGRLTVTVDGRTLGGGRTLQQAIAEARRNCRAAGAVR